MDILQGEKKPPVQFLLMTVAACIMAFNLKSLVRAAGLFPGGISGITMLIQRIAADFFQAEIPYSLIYIPLNLIPIYIGFRFIGKRFTLWTLYEIVLTSLLTDLIPAFPITSEPILQCIFGGIINGTSVALCLLAGASTGGLDFISIYMSERKGIDMWNYILLFNVAVLIVAGVLFGFDASLYSIVFQFFSTQTIPMLFKRYQKDTLLIITSAPEEVYQFIRNLTHHDATRIDGIGCYEGKVRHILYSVVGRGEVERVIQGIQSIDEKAFINVIKTQQINGRFYKSPTQ